MVTSPLLTLVLRDKNVIGKRNDDYLGTAYVHVNYKPTGQLQSYTIDLVNATGEPIGVSKQAHAQGKLFCSVGIVDIPHHIATAVAQQSRISSGFSLARRSSGMSTTGKTVAPSYHTTAPPQKPGFLNIGRTDTHKSGMSGMSGNSGLGTASASHGYTSDFDRLVHMVMQL